MKRHFWIEKAINWSIVVGLIYLVLFRPDIILGAINFVVWSIAPGASGVSSR